MPVIPYQFDLFKTHKDLDQFLHTCKLEAVAKNAAQIVSISIAADVIDPLAVLQSIVPPNQRHFYFETGGRQTAILAIGCAIELETEGPNRFSLVKDFIRNSSINTVQVGDLSGPFSGMHWFCNFSFFDVQRSQTIPDFPVAYVFLPCWQVSRSRDRSTIVANLVIKPDCKIDLISQHLWKKIQAIQTVKFEAVNWGIDHQALDKKYVSPTHVFKQSVAAALTSIRDRHLHKIVLAQALDVTAPIPFNLIASLHNLRQLYPDCYIFSSGKQGKTFLGASPERLVKIHQQQLTTDALAGSAPRGQTAAEDARLANHLLSNPKEMHEHQVVIDFIKQQLAHLGLDPHHSPARLLQLPNIQHLQTPIHAKVTNAVHLLDVVAALHPTPAVAGAPRDLACAQIRRYEVVERSLYAAPIGWVDHQGNGEFAVGIRSALLDGCHARLFAGAGIVAGSTPEQELAEVQLKLQALLAALV
jgi:menaquinone-specific isochorismate synthase